MSTTGSSVSHAAGAQGPRRTDLCPLCDGVTSRPGPPLGDVPPGPPPAGGKSGRDGVRPPPRPSVTDRPFPRLRYSPRSSSRKEKAFLLNGRGAQRMGKVFEGEER